MYQDVPNACEIALSCCSNIFILHQKSETTIENSHGLHVLVDIRNEGTIQTTEAKLESTVDDGRLIPSPQWLNGQDTAAPCPTLISWKYQIMCGARLLALMYLHKITTYKYDISYIYI